MVEMYNVTLKVATTFFANCQVILHSLVLLYGSCLIPHLQKGCQLLMSIGGGRTIVLRQLWFVSSHTAKTHHNGDLFV